MFVNLPYYAVVSVDAQKGDMITKVRRIYSVPKGGFCVLTEILGNLLVFFFILTAHYI